VFVVWIGFFVFVLMMVVIDLGVFPRKRHSISIQESLAWTGVWVVLALVFNIIPSHDLSGRAAAVQFFAAFLLEKSLSVDNIFIIAMVFAYFRIPLSEQHRVLFWGILGAVALRGVMIASGVALIEWSDWVAYLLGGLLIVSAAKMLVIRHDNLRPDQNIAVRLARRCWPITNELYGNRFFVNERHFRH